MRKSAILLLLAALALPAFAFDKVTVEQLQRAVTAARGQTDKEVAERLGNLELTERLSTSRYEKLKIDLPGDRARLALLALSDASAFLDLPPADVLQAPKPDTATQGKIVSKAADFVAATVSKMPDFFATRTTTRFKDMKVSRQLDETTLVPKQSFRLIDRQGATVTFRNGKEVVEAPGKKRTGTSVTSTTGLTNWGVFGPLLGVVMTDLLKGKMGWGHWEQGPAGPLAVFRYVVPEDRSNYTVRYCCFQSEMGEMREFDAVPAYHGEIAIDPSSGAILRLVLKTDLEPSLPIGRSDVAVEYGKVEIGGKTYICPVKSISISNAATKVFHGTIFYVDDSKKSKRDDYQGDAVKHAETVSEPKVTAINDVVFENYHEFRGEVRILPADSADTGGSAPVPAPAPSSATAAPPAK
jgi:hypothetical protein